MLLAFLAAVFTQYSPAANLSSDGQAAVPMDVQQIISVDYRAMNNSPTAMALKKRILPEELKRLEEALKGIGIKPEQDVEVLTFASFRATPKDTGKGSGSTQSQPVLRIIGVAQGEFQNAKIFAQLKKQKIQPNVINKQNVYPMGGSGMYMTLLNQTTMLFGEKPAVESAIDSYTGEARSLNANEDMLDLMQGLYSQPVWSVLDQIGTQTMLGNALGAAAAGTSDFDNMKQKLLNSRYTMNFDNGVDFNLMVNTSDNVTAATMATVLKAGMMMKKTSAGATEKQAYDDMTVDSDNAKLLVRYKADDKQFLSLLNSDLFQSVVR